MQKKQFQSPIVFSISLLTLSISAAVFAEVSEQDKEYIQDYLQRFHDNPAQVMDEIPSKEGETLSGHSQIFSEQAIESGNFVLKKNRLREKILLRASRDGLVIPYAPIQSNDNPAHLVDAGNQLIRGIQAMDSANLNQASLPKQPWSDDYWPLYKGGLGNRYGDPDLAAINPSSWYERWIFSTGTHLPQEYIASGNTDVLSPAEKYDLLVGDNDFTLTNRMWAAGKVYWDNYGEIERWMGYCHGWAPAAYMLPRPQKAIVVKSSENQEITFYPSDIKALGTLLWSEASPSVRFIGGRCNTKNPAKDANGRIIDQKCFDSNPGSWHQAVVNQIGVSQRSFVLDATYDYQVWNQPVLQYEYSYFNPETGTAYDTAEQATIAMADYRSDKFSRYRAAEASHVVGVLMKLTYMVETNPTHREQDYPAYDALQTVRYVYDLELNTNGNIIGGEWYTNLHPDFLWTPAPGARAISYYNPGNGTGGWQKGEPLPAAWETNARQASAHSQPLTRIVEQLFEWSKQ